MSKTQIMVFVLDATEYGIDISSINCIVKVSALNIIKAPESNEIFLGYVLIRGNIYPVISLRQKFALAPLPVNSDTKMIIVKTEAGLVGVLVDDVTDLFKMNDTDLSEAFSGCFSHYQKRYITGITKIDERLIIVLDINEILNSTEKLLIADVIARETITAGHD